MKHAQKTLPIFSGGIFASVIGMIIFIVVTAFVVPVTFFTPVLTMFLITFLLVGPPKNN